MKNRILLLYILVSLNSFSQSSTKEYLIHTVAFYNLENLYDTIDDPTTKDELSPILQLKTNKSDAYWSKINNIAKVISKIGKANTNTSPSIIGLAEIENSSALKDLITTDYLKNYDFVHVDSPDWRGIDVALLYKKSVFNPEEYKTFELFAFNEKGYRVRTRDQLLISGFLDNERIHLIINHWPSQRGGKQKTTYLREKSAELNLKIILDILQVEPDAKIITMGDFNDNPTEKGFKEILKTSSTKESLDTQTLFNPFEKMYQKGLGTLGFKDQLNLFDQIIISGNWIAKNKEYHKYSFYKSGIYNPSYLTQKKGRFKGYPFRSWSNTNEFTGGYSDHFPVYLYLIKEK